MSPWPHQSVVDPPVTLVTSDGTRRLVPPAPVRRVTLPAVVSVTKSTVKGPGNDVSFPLLERVRSVLCREG